MKIDFFFLYGHNVQAFQFIYYIYVISSLIFLKF